MIEKLLKFIKEKWAVIATAVIGALAYLKIKDELEARKAAEEAAEKTRRAVEEAEKAERERVALAQKKAEEDQRARDEQIKRESLESQQKLAQEVKEAVSETVEKPADQQAKDFAAAFGGSYVKKDD